MLHAFRWLYFSNWLRGDIVQYDISDPANPKFASRIWIGGVARKGGKYEVRTAWLLHCLQARTVVAV